MFCNVFLSSLFIHCCYPGQWWRPLQWRERPCTSWCVWATVSWWERSSGWRGTWPPSRSTRRPVSSHTTPVCCLSASHCFFILYLWWTTQSFSRCLMWLAVISSVHVVNEQVVVGYLVCLQTLDLNSESFGWLLGLSLLFSIVEGSSVVLKIVRVKGTWFNPILPGANKK